MEIADTSGLTDRDWAEINKLKQAWEAGGQRALNKAVDNLAADPIRYMTIIGAFFPQMVTDAIKDEMAEKGVTVEEVRALMEKVRGKPSKLH